MMRASSARHLAAEEVGTGFLLAAVVGGVLAAQFCLWIFGGRAQTAESPSEATRSAAQKVGDIRAL